MKRPVFAVNTVFDRVLNRRTSKACLFGLTVCVLQVACAQTGQNVGLEAVSVPAPAVYYEAAQNVAVLPSAGKLLQLSVRDRSTGKTLPVYAFQGEYWVRGTPGQSYAITVNNSTTGRVLATTSVDGINVLTGETAAYIQRGYVLTPQSSYDIRGWRKSEYEVAAFHFASPDASYAAQTGRAQQVGVIGVAVFAERVVPLEPPMSVQAPAPIVLVPAPASQIVAGPVFSHTHDAKAALNQAEQRSAPAPVIPPAPAPVNAPAPSAAPARPANKSHASPMQAASAPGLGTLHGQRERSYSTFVPFLKQSEVPIEVVQLRYDTAENLVLKGVLQRVYRSQVSPAPNPFPQQMFVPDPSQYVPR